MFETLKLCKSASELVHVVTRKKQSCIKSIQKASLGKDNGEDPPPHITGKIKIRKDLDLPLLTLTLKNSEKGVKKRSSDIFSCEIHFKYFL